MAAPPQYLYHYTSIESLALILSRRTIRFTRLDLVNDPEEGQSRDLSGIESWVFISCWTARTEQSLPLWNMYTRDMRGCRIRLPANPFVGRALLDGSPSTILREPIDYHLQGGSEAFIVDSVLGPAPIRYTMDEELLRPSLVTSHAQGAEFDARGVGLTKRSHWEFECEWRYRLHLWPQGKESTQYDDDEPLEPFLEVWTHSPENRYLDAPLRDGALAEMEVALGPCAGEAEIEIAQALRDRFAPGDVIPPQIMVRGNR